jgi:hypothetical protein
MSANSQKDGQPRSRDIDSLTESDAALLRRLVDERLLVGADGRTDEPASLLISRLIANMCQRERYIGRLQVRMEGAEQRAKRAENIARSMAGNDENAAQRTSDLIQIAVDGAKNGVQRRIVRWLRTVYKLNRNAQGFADAIEEGEWKQAFEDPFDGTEGGEERAEP